MTPGAARGGPAARSGATRGDRPRRARAKRNSYRYDSRPGGASGEMSGGLDATLACRPSIIREPCPVRLIVRRASWCSATPTAPARVGRPHHITRWPSETQRRQRGDFGLPCSIRDGGTRPLRLLAILRQASPWEDSRGSTPSTSRFPGDRESLLRVPPGDSRHEGPAGRFLTPPFQPPRSVSLARPRRTRRRGRSR